MSIKVVINTCFGGFGLSPKALLRLWDLGYRDNAHHVESWFGNSNAKEKKTSLDNWRTYLAKGEFDGWRLNVYSPDEQYILDTHSFYGPDKRSDSRLVQVVEELGEDSWGQHAQLKIVEIPYGTSFHIAEYDGDEHVAEDHRTWY